MFLILSMATLHRKAKIDFLDSEVEQVTEILDQLAQAILRNRKCSSVSTCESDSQILVVSKHVLSIRFNVENLSMVQKGRILCSPINIQNISYLHMQEVTILGENKIILEDGTRLNINEISTPQANLHVQKIQKNWLLAGQQFPVLQSAISEITCMDNLTVILSTLAGSEDRIGTKTFHCHSLEAISLPERNWKLKLFSSTKPGNEYKILTSVMVNTVDQVRIHEVDSEEDEVDSEELLGDSQNGLWRDITQTLILDKVSKLPSIEKISWITITAFLLLLVATAILLKKGYCQCLLPCLKPCLAGYECVTEWHKTKQIKKSLKEIEFLNKLKDQIGSNEQGDEQFTNPPPIPARSGAPPTQNRQKNTEAVIHLEPENNRVTFSK